MLGHRNVDADVNAEVMVHIDATLEVILDPQGSFCVLLMRNSKFFI